MLCSRRLTLGLGTEYPDRYSAGDWKLCPLHPARAEQVQKLKRDPTNNPVQSSPNLCAPMMLTHEPGSSRPPHSFHPGTSPGQGREGMGAATRGVEERGGGKGRYSQLRHLSGRILWPVPGWPALPASGWRLPGRPTPRVVLGSPQLAHRPGQPRFRAQKLDRRSSWSSCRAQGEGGW